MSLLYEALRKQNTAPQEQNEPSLLQNVSKSNSQELGAKSPKRSPILWYILAASIVITAAIWINGLFLSSDVDTAWQPPKQEAQAPSLPIAPLTNTPETINPEIPPTALNIVEESPIDVPSQTEAIAKSLTETPDVKALTALMPPIEQQGQPAPGMSKEAMFRRDLSKAYDAVMSGDLKTAIARYQALRKTNPDNPDIIFGEAFALQKAGRFDDALVGYDRVLQIDPNHIGAKGNMLAILGTHNPSAAIEHLRSLAARFPADPVIAAQLGTTYAKIGNYTAAQQSLTTALNLTPYDSDIMLNYAIAADKNNDLGAAIAGYTSYINTNLENADNKVDLTEIQQRLNFLKSRVSTNPKNVRFSATDASQLKSQVPLESSTAVWAPQDPSKP